MKNEIDCIFRNLLEASDSQKQEFFWAMFGLVSVTNPEAIVQVRGCVSPELSEKLQKPLDQTA